MLTFKEYLTEVWRRHGLGHADKDTVRGADVNVWALEHGDDEPHKGHYEIGFETNGREFSSDIEMHGTAGHQILKHVAGSLHRFVKEYKPKSLNFTANERKKEKPYSAFASSLARRLGGEHTEGLPGKNRIKFNHGKK